MAVDAVFMDWVVLEKELVAGVKGYQLAYTRVFTYLSKYNCNFDKFRSEVITFTRRFLDERSKQHLDQCGLHHWRGVFENSSWRTKQALFSTCAQWHQVQVLLHQDIRRLSNLFQYFQRVYLRKRGETVRDLIVEALQ